QYSEKRRIIWTTQGGILLFILSVQFTMGNLGNGFIALVNCMDWVNRRKMSSVDRILTALAISRIVSVTLLMYILYPALKITRKVSIVTITSWIVTNHFSIWLATSLSIFYFLKVANFSNSIFLFLKWKIGKVVSVTLGLSLVFLFLNILLVNTHTKVWIDMLYSSNLANSTQFSKFLLFNNCMFMLIPFTVSLTAFLLLSLSLWKHHKKMQQSGIGSRDASTMAHIKALQTGIAFLLLYAMFLFSFVIVALNFEFLEKGIIIFFDFSIGIAFHSSHAFVLILGNNVGPSCP
uniref:Taste receptor type 2 n=1 Tax=Castor canadensis TaxID=51338 RepID=A0A8C0WJU8_CASCN